MLKAKRAFTLIELLIVIAIIGVLASIVLVSTSGAREKAKLAKMVSIMRSIESIAYACTLNNGTLIMPATNGNGGTNICTVGSETLPSLAGTDFVYCGTGGCGGWVSSVASGYHAFSAYSDSYTGGRKSIVCGANISIGSWFLLSWDFSNSSGCKTAGF
ncbi:MAG: type II secretion system protein [Candidatus Moranbacteria bacterium]|nr:type II secretion system protein [Candidatus Moranbacteria bacterium]